MSESGFLVCAECGATQPRDYPGLECVKCSRPLRVEVKVPAAGGSLTQVTKPGMRGVWKYQPLLPFAESVNPVTLGEGGTPTVRLDNWGGLIGVPNAYAKLEYASPTGSFKDRGSSTLVTRLRELGVSKAVEDSSGNAGASVAAYCAKAGIKAVVFAPESAPAAKLVQIEVYGAELKLVPGARENATKAAREAARAPDTSYASHNLHPYFIEGTKTFSYEVFEDFAGALPDHVVIPVGNGSLYLGAAKGLRELAAAGFEFESPRLHLVQVEACAPLAAGAQAGLDGPAAVAPQPTIAGGISVGEPPRGREVLRTLRDFGGEAVAVTERAVWDARLELAECEGLFVEPTSAAAFAGIRRLAELGAIEAGHSVLIAVTGHGLKDPQPTRPTG